ncbi:MAG TPA: SWIB/MDM2 domain-containing protein, partial [Longimicrobium sp.]|nr:SWIB/MDM2 domain-containing protein [Longimicrobium sp.]
KGTTAESGKAKSGAGERKSSTGKKVAAAAAAAAVAAVGGAAVVAVRRSRRRKAEAAAEAGRGKAKRSRKPSGGGEKKPRAAGGGLVQPVRPDAALGAVIGGTEPRTRAEITKQVWDYIKKNGLQDPMNRREIRADATLRPVFGKDQVTMFELPKAINNHVTKV